MQEFVTSEHGLQRLKLRVRVSDRKIPKLLAKAWNAKPAPIAKLNKIEYRRTHFHRNKCVTRELMGYVFVFDTRPRGRDLPPAKILVTVT